MLSSSSSVSLFFCAFWGFFFLFLGTVSCYPKNVTEIILGYGYPCENYEVLTSDGYYLSMQRIPHGKQEKMEKSRGVVMFQHGLTDNSAGICLNPPGESLAFILADLGYDVWLGNNRGNGYSMKNIHYSIDEPEFWDFSWDEMATIDLPTQIGFVLEKTNQTQLTYIGHSEGTIQAFAGFIEDNELAKKVNIFIALAPVAFVGHVEAQILKLLARLDAGDILALLGEKEFYLPDAIKIFLPGVCTVNPALCQYVVDLLCGPTTFLNESRIDYYLNFEPNPTSVKNMIHWSQGVKYNTFAKYDYGREGNLQHYHQATPPKYDFSKFPSGLPVALFTGSHDYLADPSDVATMLQLLPTPPFVHNEVDYAHLDFIIGTNAHTRIYPMIVKLIEKYSSSL